MMNLNCIATRYPYAVHSPPVLPKRCVIVTYLDAVAYRRAYIWRAALSPWGRWRSGRTAGSSDRCDTPYARTHTYRTRTSTGTQKHGISIDARPDGRYWRDRRGADPWLVQPRNRLFELAFYRILEWEYKHPGTTGVGPIMCEKSARWRHVQLRSNYAIIGYLRCEMSKCH